MEIEVIEDTSQEQKEESQQLLLPKDKASADADFIVDSWPKNFKLLINTSINLSVARFIMSVNNYIITYYLSDIDQMHLAASSLISTVQTLTLSTAGATLNGVSYELSKALAKKDFKACSRILEQGWILAGLLSVPTVGLLLSSQPILDELGETDAITQIVENYFLFYAASVPGYLILTVNQQMALASGYPSMMLATNASLTSLTFLLNGAFKLELFGDMEFSEKTVGMANAISVWSTALFSTIYLTYIIKKQHYPFSIAIDGKIFKELLTLCKTGVPIGVSVCAEFLSITALMLMASNLGEDQAAAAGVSLAYLNLAFYPLSGLAQGNSILTRKCTAVFQLQFARRYTLMTGGLVSLAAGSACLVFATMSSPLSYLFTHKDEDQEEIDDIASSLFLINGIGLIFDAIRTTSGGIIAGHGDTLSPMLINMLCMLLILLPVAYLENDINALFITRAVMLGVAASLMTPRATLYNYSDVISAEPESDQILPERRQNPVQQCGKYTLQQVSRFCLIRPVHAPAPAVVNDEVEEERIQEIP